MAKVPFPRLSDTMEEDTISSWLKNPGDQVKKGDVIAQIETDKATMDLAAFGAGTLQEILAPEGSTVAIGKPVARIGSGGAPSSSSTTSSTTESSSPTPSSSPSPKETSSPKQSSSPSTTPT